MACKLCDTSFSLVHTQYWELKECIGVKIRIYVYQCKNGHYFAAAQELHPSSKTMKRLQKREPKKEILTQEEIDVRKKMKPLDMKKDFITVHGGLPKS